MVRVNGKRVGVGQGLGCSEGDCIVDTQVVIFKSCTSGWQGLVMSISAPWTPSSNECKERSFAFTV